MSINTLTQARPRSTNADQIRQIAVVVATLSMIVINALANIVPFNNLETGQISDSYLIYFVPAGYVFSIWGVIYTQLWHR